MRVTLGSLVALLIASGCGDAASTSAATSPSTTDDTGTSGDAGALGEAGEPGEAGEVVDATPPSLGPVRDGIATFYDATGAGNCSFDASSDLDVAAMNMPDYASSAVCGECIHIVGPSGSVDVRIVDSCPECLSGHVDMSKSAFAKIAAVELGRVSVKWQVVACKVAGPIAYKFKEGSNQWWTAIQVRNHKNPIKTLEAQVAGAWVSIPRLDYNYFVAASGLGPGPYTLRVTDTLGQALVDTGIAFSEGGVVSGSKQFD